MACWNPYLGKLGKLAPGRPRCPSLSDRCSHCRSLQAEEVWAWDAGRDCYHGILSDLVKSVTSEPTWQCTERQLWSCRKEPDWVRASLLPEQVEGEQDLLGDGWPRRPKHWSREKQKLICQGEE